MKDISEKLTINIILGERLNSFPVISGRRQVYSLLSLLFKIVLEILASTKRQEKEILIKGKQIVKEDIKFYFIQIKYQCR